MNKIKLLFVVSSSGFGGGENYVLEILKKIDKTRFFCAVCAPKNSIFMKTASKYADKTYFVPFYDNADIFSFLKLLFIIKKYNVVHANLNRAVFFAGLCGRLLKKPVIGTMHGLDKRFYYRFVGSIVFLCNFQMNHFKNYFINIEKKLINIGIDSEVEQFDENYKNNLKIHFNIPLNSKVIGTLARLHHLKGVDILIKSFEIMCKNRKDICLLIIGDGPERKKLENICKNSKIKDKIIFTGALEKPWEEAGIIMDVFVLPSYKENIPISILEAMARNIPVFASNVGGISEELPEHCIVENNDESQYSEKILSILEDKEKIKYIVKNNNLHLKNNFNVIKMVNILQEFYEQKYNL